jgi:outer membrane biosynthesis protein TonB
LILLTGRARINIIARNRVPEYVILTLTKEVIEMAEEKEKIKKKKKTAEKKAVADKPKTAKAAVRPSTKKAAAKKTPADTAAPKKAKPAVADKVPATAAKKKAPATKAAKNPTPEERYRMVETAAYFIAEQHGFQGRSDEHWVAAELQIAKLLGQ